MTTKKNVSQIGTALIKVDAYLEEYAKNCFASGLGDGSVKFPYTSTMYHCLVEGMSKQVPSGGGARDGNLMVVLPSADTADGGPVKNPRWYRYVTQRAAALINAALKRRFYYEFLTEMMRNELQGRPVPHLTLVRRFLRRNGIRSLSEDALLKKFQRYRRKISPGKVRKYHKKCKD